MLPERLKKGDTIAIIAPAKHIEREYVDYAVQMIEENGFKALVSEHCYGEHLYFSGTVQERTEDLQWAIDNDEVKAILCARGGFGCIQIIDRVNWAGILTEPKWIIGFSDVTVFHQFLAKMKICSLHATMPLNFKENSSEALSSLFDSLQGKKINYKWDSKHENIKGETEGEIIGGNLTVLCGLIGTKQMPDYQNKILFIEDVGEPLYAIDRLFYQLNNSGVLSQIKGLIVGNFSNLKDSDPPYGSDLQSIIKSHFKYNPIPISFGFPGGHCDDNRALVLGGVVKLVVEEDGTRMTRV